MFGLFIVGVKGQEQRVGSGAFHCPSCGFDTRYTHYRIARVFTLFFIPLFVWGDLGQMIRCDRCGREFAPEILKKDSRRINATTPSWSCVQCGNLNPNEYRSCVACGIERSG